MIGEWPSIGIKFPAVIILPSFFFSLSSCGFFFFFIWQSINGLLKLNVNLTDPNVEPAHLILLNWNDVYKDNTKILH